MVEPKRVDLDDCMKAGAAAQIAATSLTVLLQGTVPMSPKLRDTGDMGRIGTNENRSGIRIR